MDIVMPPRKKATQKHLETDLKQKMCTAGFSYSGRKMEAAVQEHRTEDEVEWSVACGPLGATRHKSSQVIVNVAASSIDCIL